MTTEIRDGFEIVKSDKLALRLKALTLSLKDLDIPVDDDSKLICRNVEEYLLLDCYRENVKKTLIKNVKQALKGDYDQKNS